MTHVLVECDGAQAPAKIVRERDWTRTAISHRGGGANLQLTIQAPQVSFADGLTGRGADLLKIAAYAFGADQEIKRGGGVDQYGDDWRRHFMLCVPVAEPEFWASAPTQAALRAALGFVSDDQWDFAFSSARAVSQRRLSLIVDPTEGLSDPDVVVLFSGGLDSLSAAVDATARLQRRPILISHSPAFNIKGRQAQLRASLSRELRGRGWHFPRFTGAVHRNQSDAKENSQRTRSFLYAAFGIAVAHELGIRDVLLPDNGVVSLNLPINAQLLGARASRSTHPRFFRLLNQLVRLIFDEAPVLSNPLWNNTRAETLGILKREHAERLIDEAVSCSHPRGRTTMQPHCGVCFQCVDRRFATVAADLEEFDYAERYEVDIFRHGLKEGPARTMCLSYYQFAMEVADLPGEAMFARYQELYDCVDPEASNAAGSAQEFVSLINRHGATITKTMERVVERLSSSLARQQLPPTCLPVLVAGQDAFRSTRPKFLQSDNFMTATINGVTKTLTLAQGAVIHRLKVALDDGLPEVRWSDLKQAAIAVGASPDSISDVFKDRQLRDLFLREIRRGVYRLNLDD